MNNSLSSVIIDNMVHEYYVNGVRVTRGYAGRHSISLSARVFRRLITLIKITGKPYNRYKNLLHTGIVDIKDDQLYWIHKNQACMSYYKPYKWKCKYLSLFSVRK